MDVKGLRDRIAGKEVMLEVKYDDFEMETTGIVEELKEIEQGIKVILANKTTVYTSYDYLIEDEDTIFFMERISDNQEAILALLKVL